MDQTAALEEGALTVNAAGVVSVALAYVDDTALCCASKSGFDPASCLLRSSTAATLAACSAMSVSVGGPHAVPNPLCSRLTRNPQRLASQPWGWYSVTPWQVS